MSVNDIDGYAGPEPEDIGLTLCPECNGVESPGCHVCNSNGWLLYGNIVSTRIINKQFELLYILRNKWRRNQTQKGN